MKTEARDYMQLSYAERREALYGPLRREGVFTWDRMYDQEYALAGLIRLSDAALAEMHKASEALGRVYARTVSVVQQSGPALWSELGLPGETFGTLRLRLDESVVTMIGRFDFAMTKDGLKMLEFNSDTPTGIVEAFHVNGHICDAYGAVDPNAGCSRRLSSAFKRMLRLYEEAGYRTERVVFSSLGWHEEDAGTTRYLQRESGIAGAAFAPLEALRIKDDGLWVEPDGDGCELEGWPAGLVEEAYPVDVLYRLHALEKLAEDRDADEYPTGAHALQFIADGRVAIMNPPSAFAAQTKALQALIWNLHEAGQFYSREEHEAIGRWMLPTYMEPSFAAGTPYVAKPVFGREGSSVTIYDGQGHVREVSGENEYGGQPMVYQQFVELPKVSVETLGGPYDGRLLWGCFLIDGEGSAVIARVGGNITSNLSYYLPCALE